MLIFIGLASLRTYVLTKHLVLLTLFFYFATKFSMKIYFPEERKNTNFKVVHLFL